MLVDTVGAKNDVIHIIRDLRAKGLAIIVLSTEPETVLSLADRILVLKRGALVREFANEPVSKDRLLEAAQQAGRSESEINEIVDNAVEADADLECAA